MNYRWSSFVVQYPLNGERIILKNFLTGAVIMLTRKLFNTVNAWFGDDRIADVDQDIQEILFGDNGFIVETWKDEHSEYLTSFLKIRNEKANLFSLHLLPTMKCQLQCPYCFENGVKRMGAMSPKVLDQSVNWISQYLVVNSQVTSFRCVLFGGEPLLEKNLVTSALSKISSVVKSAGVQFWTDITTNGDLFDPGIASVLKEHNCRKIQITLDGPKEIHDTRRCNRTGYVSFDRIVTNVRMLLDGNFVEKVNLRISLDEETAELVPNLLDYLAGLGYGNRIQLSLGIVVPSLGTKTRGICEGFIAEKAVNAWKVALELGFEIPEEFLLGPWCVAIAKHSAVLQSNGSLQKCFCTVGRPEFDFTEVFQMPESYSRDGRFEQFSRMNDCVREKCPYLPICGGGCIHDSVVKYGLLGFSKRFCQKELINRINEGLIFLKYRGKE
ncbi:MAG: radical SAM protein [Candidatus Paceibacterota bacterium]